MFSTARFFYDNIHVHIHTVMFFVTSNLTCLLNISLDVDEIENVYTSGRLTPLTINACIHLVLTSIIVQREARVPYSLFHTS